MGSISEQQPKRPMALTICGYRKPGMSEEDYHKYLSEVHAPLCQDLMVRHGIIRWTMTHNTSAAKSAMARIAGPQMDALSDYDCIVNIVFGDVENFERMKDDPFYFEKVMPDHENFADTRRSRMSVGWVEDHVRDGKAVF